MCKLGRVGLGIHQKSPQKGRLDAGDMTREFHKEGPAIFNCILQYLHILGPYFFVM